MRKLLASATLVALGLGAAVAGAQNIAGSDTLNFLTTELVDGINGGAPVCTGAAALTYIGGGSGAGESAIIQATGGQTVAPMSRFLAASAAVCAKAGGTTNAEGIAIAVDGLSIVASTGLNEAHRTACDSLAQTGAQATCVTEPATAGTSGLAHASGDWRRALRLVYFGLEGATPSAAPSAVDPLTRACGGTERTTLVNTWGNLFQNNCATSDCTQLQHAFRRDENSGTTDVFRELLRVNGSAQTGNAGMPFCNEYVAGNGTPPAGPPALVGGTIAGQPGLPQGPYFELFQDMDPVRRTCIGTNNNANPLTPSAPSASLRHEQVCGPRGSLGLVLPISVPQEKPVDQIFATLPCGAGAALGNAVNVTAGTCPGSGLTGLQSRYLLCPNGSLPFGSTFDSTLGVACGGSGSCFVPVNTTAQAGVLNRACLAGQNTRPPYFSPSAALNIPATEQDGRAWNLWPRTQAGQLVTQAYRVNGVLAERPIVGAFYRIHSSRTAITPASGTITSDCLDGVCCQEFDSTRQIGCLVQASPCSIGYAGIDATTAALDARQIPAGSVYGAFSLSVNGVNPVTPSCVTGGAYSLSRLLYFNSLSGFDTASAADLAMTQCAVDPTLMAPVLARNDFLPITGGPCCNDFGDDAANTACPNGENACADNAAVGLPTSLCSVP